MKIKQIRNATLLISFENVKFLIDPYLAPKEHYEGFLGTMNSELRNPRVELKTSMDEILDVDAVIITHTHPDHFDEVAANLIPKDMKIFVKDEKDKEFLSNLGFLNLEILPDCGTKFKNIEIFKTPAQHGDKEKVDEILKQANMDIDMSAIGVVLKGDDKSIYIAGDTIFYDEVKNCIMKFNPDIIILNAGDARLIDNTPIIMGKDDVKSVSLIAPNSKVIASHMEAVNHAVLSRDELKEFLEHNKLSNVLIPNDNEEMVF